MKSPPKQPTIRDSGIPPDFFALLEELENTLETQSVSSYIHTESVQANSPNCLTPATQTTNAIQVVSNNPIVMRKSISTQTKSAHDIKWAVKKEHKHTNTNHVTTHDKSTNTNPLVVLDPDNIKTLQSGLHIATYTPFHQIFICTNNSTSIVPTHRKPIDINQTPIRNIAHNHTTVNTLAIPPVISSTMTNTRTTTTMTNSITATTNTHKQPIAATAIANTPSFTDEIHSHMSDDNITTDITNIKPTYKPDQLKVRKRVQWDSSSISKLLQEQMKDKCDITITKLPRKNKSTKPVNTHKKLTKLARKYYPYEIEQHRTPAAHAHKTHTDTDWVSLLNEAYNPTKPEIIHIDEEPTNVRPTASTDEKAIILDEHFKDGLCDLFGDVSSSDED